MLPPRLVTLMLLLLAVNGWCKPAKSTEGYDYNDDNPLSEYNDDDTTPDDDDDPGTGLEDPPQIISGPVSIHERVGSTIRLPCVVKNTENFAITWKKDNEFLYSDSNPITSDHKRIVRDPNNTLVIYRATVQDSSNNYECSILTKPPIVLTHRVLIDPERAPTTTTTQPHKPVIRVTPGKRVEVSAGESVTLGCEIKMKPSPKIKWYHESRTIGGDMIVDDNHIIIKNINRHDNGRYQCLAEDSSEDPSIAAINVIVNYSPEIEVKKDLVHTGIGVESDLTCIVHAHPHAKVTWYKDQKEITPEKGKIAFRGNKTVHTLGIMHTDPRDFGEYKCVALNRMGQDVKTITLTGAPSQAVIHDGERTITDTGLILKWQLESYSPITEYKLQYRRKGSDEWNVVQPAVKDGKGNQFIVEYPLEGLPPGSYEAILTARNDFGWSQPSVPHIFIGEYAAEEAENVKGSAASIRPLGAIVALFLVVSSCAFSSL